MVKPFSNLVVCMSSFIVIKQNYNLSRRKMRFNRKPVGAPGALAGKIAKQSKNATISLNIERKSWRLRVLQTLAGEGARGAPVYSSTIGLTSLIGEPFCL